MDPADAEALVRSARTFGLTLDAGALDRLARFVDLLNLWNARFRLTGDRDPALVVRKHVVDALAFAAHAAHAGPVVDIGSGAGFPGIPTACVRPALDVVLIESRRRPASFLAEVVRVLPLPAVRVVHARAEDAARDGGLVGRAAVVTARAVRLDVLLALARPWLAPGGVVVAMQTPATATAATHTAERAGFRVERRVDYRVGDAAARCLLFFSLVC